MKQLKQKEKKFDALQRDFAKLMANYDKSEAIRNLQKQMILELREQLDQIGR